MMFRAMLMLSALSFGHVFNIELESEHEKVVFYMGMLWMFERDVGVF